MKCRIRYVKEEKNLSLSGLHCIIILLFVYGTGTLLLLLPLQCELVHQGHDELSGIFNPVRASADDFET